MMSCLHATCTVRMSSLCQFSSDFLSMTPTHFVSFPSFSFHSLFSFLFSSWCFICFGVLLSFPRFLSISLVSFSCFFLCFCSFMVDYSSVRLDCLLVSLFFACLCGLIKVVGRKRPRVGLFIEKKCPYRFVMLFLFPLVYCSVGIAQSLVMSGKDEVRSSELETSLSSFKDHGDLEVTSPFTPHKAWGIRCSLRRNDEKRIRDRFQFPSFIKIRIPDGDNRACHSYANEVCFCKADFVNGVRFPIHLLLDSYSSFYNLLRLS